MRKLTLAVAMGMAAVAMAASNASAQSSVEVRDPLNNDALCESANPCERQLTGTITSTRIIDDVPVVTATCDVVSNVKINEWGQTLESDWNVTPAAGSHPLSQICGLDAPYEGYGLSSVVMGPCGVAPGWESPFAADIYMFEDTLAVYTGPDCFWVLPTTKAFLVNPEEPAITELNEDATSWTFLPRDYEVPNTGGMIWRVAAELESNAPLTITDEY